MSDPAKVFVLIFIAGIVGVGFGYALSIPLAKWRHERQLAEQVDETVRIARHAIAIEGMSGELTEGFLPFAPAHSPAQPGRKVLDFAAARRRNGRHFRHARRGVLRPTWLGGNREAA